MFGAIAGPSNSAFLALAKGPTLVFGMMGAGGGASIGIAVCS